MKIKNKGGGRNCTYKVKLCDLLFSDCVKRSKAGLLQRAVMHSSLVWSSLPGLLNPYDHHNSREENVRCGPLSLESRIEVLKKGTI